MHITATLHTLPTGSATADHRFLGKSNGASSVIATVHAHPACKPIRVFEVRHLAREHGCTFIASKHKRPTRSVHAPFDPNDGGRAA
ncbi:hypothetical protein PF66_06167 [Pseudomonas asplenii]|uniref:Uncharacterized protein n=1 Tax=Pseudomonas asplenii TaxID=53407 RepID=A0A0N0E143_9PSED|nr:hypothetical protein PF66_06167 [Pseudomonas fuscovaginae]